MRLYNELELQNQTTLSTKKIKTRKKNAEPILYNPRFSFSSTQSTFAPNPNKTLVHLPNTIFRPKNKNAEKKNAEPVLYNPRFFSSTQSIR